MPALRGLLLAALMAAACGAAPAGRPDEPWTAAERGRVLALGPWPPAPARLAGDAVSGKPAAIALGETLFHSARLADNGGVRCATCHEPWRGFADGRPRALGVALGPRRTPSLLDVAGTHRRFGWTGASGELRLMTLRPLRDANEMPASDAHVAALVRDDPALAARYAEVFGARPDGDDGQLTADVGRLLAAYVETLASPPTAFDHWRDAWAASAPDAPPPPGLSPAALRGLQLFVGRGGCVACHAGPGFTDDALHGAAEGPIRTPGLRGTAAAGPWMHDGSLTRLCDALRPHAGAPATPLDAAARDDLAAFLRTLAPSPLHAPERCGRD